MKYKRGSKVEVLTTGMVPYQSWHCAQIVSGNGHNYTVQYEVYPGFTNKGKVGRVSRKFIRPCPPTVKMLECWPGDVVEVYHNLSWKMAIVSKALGRDLFLVRLVGSFLEFEASKPELRVRQSWQNDEWVVIGKNDNLQESHIVSTRTLKRGLPCYFSQDEVNAGSAQKFRLAQKEGKRLQVLVTSPEKVDVVPNSRKMMCEKCMYTSFDNRPARLYAAAVEREDLSDAFRCSCLLCKEPNDDNGVTCSVGSCSTNSYRRSTMSYKSAGFEDIEEHDSDAESICQWGYEDLSLCNKELAAEIHRLELEAYRRTIEALHASGPLSWEKETMAQSWRLVHLASESVS